MNNFNKKTYQINYLTKSKYDNRIYFIESKIDYTLCIYNYSQHFPVAMKYKAI